jgi:hypothetical protein
MPQHILLAEFGVTEMSIESGFGIHATIKLSLEENKWYKHDKQHFSNHHPDIFFYYYL